MTRVTDPLSLSRKETAILTIRIATWMAPRHPADVWTGCHGVWCLPRGERDRKKRTGEVGFTGGGSEGCPRNKSKGISPSSDHETWEANDPTRACMASVRMRVFIPTVSHFVLSYTPHPSCLRCGSLAFPHLHLRPLLPLPHRFH
ncbi:hypothetical protein GW17_00036693 [Ensete ventricosum]|nr:hypothetical protein GW17_00036693 [Ensete ventricosum]